MGKRMALSAVAVRCPSPGTRGNTRAGHALELAGPRERRSLRASLGESHSCRRATWSRWTSPLPTCSGAGRADNCGERGEQGRAGGGETPNFGARQNPLLFLAYFGTCSHHLLPGGDWGGSTKDVKCDGSDPGRGGDRPNCGPVPPPSVFQGKPVATPWKGPPGGWRGRRRPTASRRSATPSAGTPRPAAPTPGVGHTAFLHAMDRWRLPQSTGSPPDAPLFGCLWQGIH